ncbi:hypothetical protein IRY61_00720 [Candidatus Saccharibacteria bacterium]|nr:hypothetical protein [Candidatus Saccharibacteria bacterium]
MTKAQPTLESIERVPGSPPQLSEGDLYDIAATYADAFAGEPWNEFTRCSGDGRFYGKDTTSGQPCPDGDGGVLELAYPRKETADYIARELTRPDVSLFLLRKMGGIAGFGWGFSYASPEAFAKDKYRTPEMKQTVVSLLGRSGITGKFYYLSEVGLADDPNIRGRGLSRGFLAGWLQVARELQLPALLRTSCSGPMYRTSQAAGMKQIMGPEVVVDTKTRAFIPTGRIINGVSDTENSQRVLFVAT